MLPVEYGKQTNFEQGVRAVPFLDPKVVMYLKISEQFI